MLNLYFVRHGQTEWNVAKRIQGHKDSALTKKGVDDAKRLGMSLQDVEWTAIYSSPSKRTLKTATIIKGKQSRSIIQDRRLMEMHLGDWEGLMMEEIKELNAVQHDNYWKRPSEYERELGENFLAVRERTKLFIDDLLLKYKSGNILIVTHGVVIKTVQIIVGKLELDKLWSTAYIDGTSVTKVEVKNNKMELQLEGDLSHLQKYVKKIPRE